MNGSIKPHINNNLKNKKVFFLLISLEIDNSNILVNLSLKGIYTFLYIYNIENIHLIEINEKIYYPYNINLI